MKRLIIIGAILAGVVAWVLIAHQAVFTSTGVGPGSGSKYMIIKVDTRTGIVKSKMNEDDVAAEEVSEAEYNGVAAESKAKGRWSHVGSIYYSHLSPGCVWIQVLGKYYRICY
jgi:hypothetical protein